ncbi:polysaccharide biosynthesis/export family protein [Caulobacter sp. 17J65-9]|uniref:polysaccharide biosynthesis/export family protein n=1 Tax=Caulobacter sp. 17J65-9 TaxID=2709382 RepID=UPI0013CA44AF|nr:polysaccharide biosynthesis/export family protein [Caulobacter sp. 17J65-9]NEX94880.1 polysaccharide export protein [Caulobacter sp. 17J65-9]
MASKALLAITAALLGAGAAQAQNPTQIATTAPGVHAAPRGEYRIGPLDKLNITVFQVKDLTLDRVQVDASGRILLPLIGQVMAAGRTTTELSDEIAAKLEASYLQHPQVSVVVSEAASQKVTVDGAVTEAGVFELRGRTTLLQAVAMAKGPARNANLKRVAVFRQIDGQRQAAVFDLKAIRKGKAEDPEIYGDDVIVVDSSGLKGAWREVLGALPAFSIFRPY